MQDNKNLILAVVLCLIVLFGWGYVAEYMGWTPKPQITTQDAEKTITHPKTPQPAPEAQISVFTPSPGRDFSVSTPLYDAVFYTGGGPLRSFMLKNYHVGILPDSPLVNMVDKNTALVAPLGLVINGQPSWSTGKWSLQEDTAALEVESGSGSFTLMGETDNFRISRNLSFSANTYLIREKLVVSNPDSKTRSIRIRYTAAMDASQASGGQYDSMRLAWDNNGSLDEETSANTLATTGVQATGKIYWAGPMSTYFLSAVIPADPDGVTMMGRMEKTVYRTALEGGEVILGPGESKELEVSYWIGPKDRAMLNAVSEQLGKSIDLGFFSGIAKILLWLLEFFQKYVHNWGIAIILLTILIKAVFWPLTAKSYASMEKMKELQPMMLKLREKYKNNKEEMNKEVMALYKTYKINPASGCVPILIQLPVFFGLYQALLTSLALRHASFITYLPGTDIIWLADLSAKDPLYITPIVMGITMFLQQRMSPPAQDPMQQKIMMFLPLIFTVLFINFPSGLVIYWLVNNVLSIFQQWLMMRKNKKKHPVTAKG